MRMNDSEWLEYQMTLREQARATSFGENWILYRDHRK
jgi:hypothetical protein